MDLSLGLGPSLSPEVINLFFLHWLNQSLVSEQTHYLVPWNICEMRIMAIPLVTINDESVIYNQNVREGLPWPRG